MASLRKLITVFGIACSTILSSCAVNPSGSSAAGEMEIRSGVIEQITPVQIQSPHHTGVGAVVGGIAGLGIGSLIGGGTGKDVAMALGALGGAVAGNEMQKNYDQPVPGQQIIVRTTNGVLVSVSQPVDNTLYKGEKVYIEGTGNDARVVAQ